MTADPRARWADLLRLPTDATSDDAAVAFFRALPGDQFMPSAERVAASNALAGASAPTGRDRDIERLLCDEVEAFAARFWILAPGERLTAWAELSQRGADPARLLALEPGLNVGVIQFTNPVTEELARLFRELFVMRPRERSIRRNAWLLEHAAEAEKWQSALAALQRSVPEMVALEPQLATALGPNFSLAEFTAAATQRVREPSASRSPSHPIKLAHRLGPRPWDIPSTETPWIARNLVWIALVGVVGLLQLIAALSNRSPSRYQPVTPNTYKPATTYNTSRTLPQHTYSLEQVQMFREYERSRAEGRAGIAPDGYLDWVRYGRPAPRFAKQIFFSRYQVVEY